MRVLLLSVLLLITARARAQGPDPVLVQAEWNPLPDSLFLVWKLEDDQVKRLRMIEEDYDAERAEAMADTALPASERNAVLARLARERRNEVKGVLQSEHYDDWLERTGR